MLSRFRLSKRTIRCHRRLAHWRHFCLASFAVSNMPSSSLSASSTAYTAAHSGSSSIDSVATLFLSLPVVLVCKLLNTADVLALSSVNLTTRRLILSSPAVWRARVLRGFPPLPAVSAASSSSRLKWLCDVVEVVDVEDRSLSTPDSECSTDCPASIAHLISFPSLRYVHCDKELLPRHQRAGHTAIACSPITSTPSLSSMRHLTRVSLLGGELTEDMRLLLTLPTLASFSAHDMTFTSGSDDTLRQWQAFTIGKEQQQRSGKRKADQLAGGGDDDDEEDAVNTVDDVKEGKGGENQRDYSAAEDDEREEDANDPNVARRRSALLLFLHALAAKPSLVHLDLGSCGLTPFVLDHMPVWPYLLSLDLHDNDSLDNYRFEHAFSRFPSLTSLTSPSTSEAAIAQLVRLPALEELRFPDCSCGASDEDYGAHSVTPRLHSLLQAAKLRSVYYSPPFCGSDGPMLNLSGLTSLFTLTNLIRITISAACSLDGVFTHRFEHLRCLELIQQHTQYDTDGCWRCPQTDDQLMPLVKPLDVMIDGRQQRQARRAAVRGRDVYCYLPTGCDEDHEDEKEALRIIPVISADNAANFPSLECLALPYGYYGLSGNRSGEVSVWTKRQLRRSYEYEVAEEWEAECTTLGCAELLKSIMA